MREFGTKWLKALEDFERQPESASALIGVVKFSAVTLAFWGANLALYLWRD